MDSAIEEALFGAGRALSPIVLSMEQEKPISLTRKALESFYKAHSSKLSAAYCITGRCNGSRVIRIVSDEELETHTSNIENASVCLYTVAPANSTDEVVLAGLAQRRSELAASLTNEQLAKTERILNPLHSDSWQPRPKPEALVPGKPEVTTAAEPAPKAGAKQEPKPTKPTESSTNSTSTGTKSSKQDSTNAKKAKGVSSFFGKGTREDALKSTKRDAPLKAVNSVVAAVDVEEDDDLEILAPSAKKQQLEKLKDMFDPAEDMPANQEPIEEEQEIDVVMLQSPEPIVEPEAELEAEIPMEVEEEIPQEISEQQTLEHSPEPEQQDTVQEKPIDLTGSHDDGVDDNIFVSGGEPRVVETELDDGWSLTEIETPAVSKPKPKPQPKKAAQPAATNKSKSQPTMNLPKIPAKPGKKQQPTLTSFFSKRA